MEDQHQEVPVENPLYTPSEEVNEYLPESSRQSAGVPMQNISPVQWSASEYIVHEKSPKWYLGLFGFGSLTVILMYLITRDILAALVVLVAGGAMSVYAGRNPETKQYIIDENGIKVGDKSYPYFMFKSFSVVEEGAIDSVWLKPMKRFSPLVVMYFAPADEQRIIDVLANFLPHEDRELDLMDQISKRIRF